MQKKRQNFPLMPLHHLAYMGKLRENCSLVWHFQWHIFLQKEVNEEKRKAKQALVPGKSPAIYIHGRKIAKSAVKISAYA